MRQWTEQQKNAIDARGGNIIVSAAAGSGKTAVLVERVVRIIADKSNPVDIDKLLVVTFTKAAAAEMKARISARLQQMLIDDPSDNRIMRQLSLLPSAKISTIDAFCQNIVRENFYELNVSQDFTVLDESEADVISDNALNTVLDAFYEKGDADFIRLVESLSNPKDETGLISALKKVYNNISAQPQPLAWLKKVIEAYRPGQSFQNSVWYPNAREYVADRLNYALELSEKCLSFMDVHDDFYGYYSEFLGAENEQCRSLIRAFDKGWDALLDALSNIKFSRFDNKKTDYHIEMAERRKLYKSVISSVRDYMILKAESFERDNLVIYPVLSALYRVVERYSQEYMALKNERNAYTFSDIMHFALKLLMDFDDEGNIIASAAAKELQSQFYEILIDEYQDTNSAQDTLFRLLSNGSNRFMVGDVKQSIYRFRSAMPYIFNQKKEAYKAYNKEAPHGDSRIILDKNFRSRNDICSFTNFLFSRFMSKKAGELDYDENEYLNCGADYPEHNSASISFKITDHCQSSDVDVFEARQIAKLITEKVESREQISDSGAERAVCFGDFAVLFRHGSGHIETYAQVLAEYGIPAVCESKSNLLDCEEIKMLLSYLKVIDNPTRDIPLLAVLTSPMYGFTADELAQIKLDSGSAPNLYARVARSDSEKAKNFIDEIQMLSKVSVTMSVSSFIRYLCEYKSIFAFINALGNGAQRNANIEAFISFAQTFDHSAGAGLTAFLRLVDGASKTGGGIKPANLSTGGENAVKLMTVHNSKGLEFPVVILAGTVRNYNYTDLNDNVLFNEHLGISIKKHNEEMLCRTDTLPHKIMKEVNKNAALSENLRVLYVAITRAKEQFIPFISVNDLKNCIEKNSVRIADGGMEPCICLDIKNDADFLLCAALLHKGGEKLRGCSKIDIPVCESDFELDVDISEFNEGTEISFSHEPAEADDKILSLIDERVNYKYPGLKNQNIVSKLNASQLDGNEEDIQYFALSKPAFMNESGLTPGQRGTAMHTFMQFCDYAAAKDNLSAEIQRLLSLGFLSKIQADSLDTDRLRDFFNGRLARRIFSADKVYREIKISSFVEANQIFDTESTEKVLVRGIADCVFEEQGKLVLVDYKTDRLKSEQELLDRYKNQIAFYRETVEKTLGMPVKTAALYSFYMSKVCEY